jgi:hypothetical protein
MCTGELVVLLTLTNMNILNLVLSVYAESFLSTNCKLIYLYFGVV